MQRVFSINNSINNPKHSTIMAEVKYAIVNFQPTANQAAKGMGHSVYAVNVIDNVINNQELAKKIENRGISRQSEITGYMNALRLAA